MSEADGDHLVALCVPPRNQPVVPPRNQPELRLPLEDDIERELRIARLAQRLDPRETIFNLEDREERISWTIPAGYCPQGLLAHQ